jgi:hypothetical protein
MPMKTGAEKPGLFISFPKEGTIKAASQLYL